MYIYFTQQAQEDAMKNDLTKVVIRFIPILNIWCICHAKSYQSAFGSNVNKFDSRNAAIEFAEKNNCEVIFHSYDQLQQEEK